MARTRYIKPDFFTDENIIDLDFASRLLFVGLWTIADREGRLENKPRQIKIQLFPCDDLDVAVKLRGLHEKKLIILYTVENKEYIQIPNFLKHQRPHTKEAPSTLPAVKLHGSPENYTASTPKMGMGMGMGMGNGEVPDKAGTEATRTPKAKSSATEINPDFTPTKADQLKLAAECPDVQLETETANFVDHYLGNGEKGKDWNARWRKWIRNQQKWTTERKPNGQASFAPKNNSGYDPTKDISSPHYVMPPAPIITFLDHIDHEEAAQSLSTPEAYEESRAWWLARNPGKEDEVKAYELTRRHRARFTQTGSNAD